MGKTPLVRLAAAAAGGTLAFAAAAPAMAQDDATELTLQPSHQGTFSADHGQECDPEDERMAGLADDQDGWHFVASGGTFVSLTVTFAPGGDPDDADDLEVVTGDPESDGPIDFYAAGSLIPHAYMFVPAGWMLVTATADVEGGQQLVVSHTCAGEPGEDGDDGNDGEGGDNGDGGEDGEEEEKSDQPDEELPVTGSQVGQLLGLGGGLLAVGGALAVGVTLLAARRRRQLTELTDG